MIKRFLSSILLSLSFAASVLGVVALPSVAHAQLNTGLNQVGNTVILPNTDPRTIAANVINVLFGFLGIIFVCLILYAGFVYMTSGGEPKQTGRAKSILSNAIIGLLIILSAWGIANYVITQILGATQGTGGGSVSGGTGTGVGGGFGGSGSGAAFVAKTISPSGSVSIRNIEVKIQFNKPVDATKTLPILVAKTNGATVAGTLVVDPTDATLVTFTPSAACPPPNVSRFCFDANTDFTVTLGAIVSAAGQTISCNGFGNVCSGTFHTGSLVDTQPPTVKFTYPSKDGDSISADSIPKLMAQATDDAGVATVQFFDGDNSIGFSSPGTQVTPFKASINWKTNSTMLGRRALSAVAHDIDTNISLKASVSVMVRAAHCFNTKIDPPYETGLNCGGDSTSDNYCGACAGDSCATNDQCSTGFCVNFKCVAQPVIRSVTPDDGKVGTFVTIDGANFGNTPGTVNFTGLNGHAVLATAPAACSLSGAATWSNWQVVVAVPAGAQSGPIQVINATSNLVASTNPADGTPDFTVNTKSYPGLCSLVPTEGAQGDSAKALGQGFGSGGIVLFDNGGEPASAVANSWNDAEVNFRVPIVDIGTQPVTIQASGTSSNPVDFSVGAKVLPSTPTITSVDPVSGPPGQYVTIFGSGFGSSLGTVTFSLPDGSKATGRVDFPAACTSFWRDNRIIIKVPPTLDDAKKTSVSKATYQITVKRQEAGAAPSNGVSFGIDPTLLPTPGICAIEPSSGPVTNPPIAVKIYGDGFGSTKPSVAFYNGQSAVVTSNANQEVDTTIPAAAVTGPVSVTTVNSLGKSAVSNKVNFQVRNCNEASNVCETGQKCCPTGECRATNAACGSAPSSAEFAWQTSTGFIPVAPYVVEECDATSEAPSPSPWQGRAGGDQAPVNATITLLFSRLLDSSTLGSQFLVYKCAGTTLLQKDACATETLIPSSSFTFANVPKGSADDTTQSLITLTPSTKLSPSTVYEVKVLQSVKAAGVSAGVGGTTMDQMVSCGTGTGGQKYGYCFRFTTRESTDNAKVGSVDVAPTPAYLHDQGKTETFEVVPRDADDRCIVLNANDYAWNWYTGAGIGSDPNNLMSSDRRATLPSPLTKNTVNGFISGTQVVTAQSETGENPVPVHAQIAELGPDGFANLFVNFVPPKVLSYAPNCDFACTNAQIWADFSTTLDAHTVTKDSVDTDGTVKLYKCANESCESAGLIEVPLTSVNSTGDSGRKITINPPTLAAGSFYRVILAGGVDGILATNGLPMEGENDPQGFTWTFRVKQNPDALCTANRVGVEPGEKYETVVGARQLFTATPYGKPDQCSPSGQALVQTTASAWKSADANIASFYTLSGALSGTPTTAQLVDTGAPLSTNCSGACLAMGSNGQSGKVAVCGDKVISPGEECEPSLQGAICNPDTCLFRPATPVTTAGGTCGNGVIDRNASVHEMCDPGTHCSINGVLADTVTSAVDCAAAKGTWGVYDFRFCSAGCRNLGSVKGGSTCGNGDVANGEDCDYGSANSLNGCSSVCLDQGSKSITKLVAICGNGVVEPGEVCDSRGAGGPFPDGCDAVTCLHTGTPTCGSGTGAQCCGNARIDLGEDCDDGNSDSGDGCSSSCLLEGSSVETATPSFCGDGKLEYGEQCDAGALTSNAVAQEIGYDRIPDMQTGLTALRASKYVYTPASGIARDDSSQLAQIVGKEQPKPADDGLIQTTLSATMLGQTGNATYGLQCGYTDENSCPTGDGLDANGCCAPRPKVAQPTVPFPGQGNVCRNVLIEAGFNEAMDTGSVVNNFEIVEASKTSTCGAGTTPVSVEGPSYAPGFAGWVHQSWDRVVAFVTGNPAYADTVWCKGGVTGHLVAVGSEATSQHFAFTLDQALAPNTQYRIRFMGDNSTSTLANGAPDVSGLADNADSSNRWGVKTADGVVLAKNDSSLMWTFTTGANICTADVVSIFDTTDAGKAPPLLDAHPFLFTNEGDAAETRSFSAAVESIQDGVAVPLSSIANVYAWNWMNWTTANPDLVTIKDATSKSSSASAISSNTKNGTTILSAGVTITADEGDATFDAAHPPSKTGVASVTVLACHNPWPDNSVGGAPFRDMNGSGSFFTSEGMDPKALHNFNFSTTYCMDASQAGSTAGGQCSKSGASCNTTTKKCGAGDTCVFSNNQDLPPLNIRQVALSASDKDIGILREYLFTYPKENQLTSSYQGLGLGQDGVGIRIMQNQQHLSPESWYKSRGFSGTPTSLLVDGYPAIKDGTTIYVAAANRELAAGASSGPIYSNIYIISYNAGASPVTLNIFNQLVSNLSFNINPDFVDQTNVCKNGKVVYDGPKYDQAPVSCKADWECLKYDPNLHCDSTKLKLVRDTLRMTDFQYLSSALETKKDGQGRYPQLTGGSFLQNQTNSLWSSWDKQLGTALAVSPMPLDPVNKFLTCGQCSASFGPCQTSTDCPTNETCQGGLYKGTKFTLDSSVDPVTCWQQSHTGKIGGVDVSYPSAFTCPMIPGTFDPATGLSYGVSHVYQYQTYSNGTQYSIGSEFEVPPPADPTNWWTPPLPQTFYACTSNDPSVNGRSCMNSSGKPDDSFCRPCPNGVCTKCQGGTNVGNFCIANADCPLATGAGTASCAETPKVATVAGSCHQVGATFKYSGVCQNISQNDAGRCGDGIVQKSLGYSETCDSNSPPQLAKCTTSDGKVGHRQQICDIVGKTSTTSACQGYVDDPTHPQCIADAQCGNGRIDLTCGGSATGIGCLTNADCSSGVACLKAESCDDGKLNGTYGHCNSTCTNFGAYCGDGVLSPGEKCDFGTDCSGGKKCNGSYVSTAAGLSADPSASCSTDCQQTAGYCGDGITQPAEMCDGNSDTTQSAICSSGPFVGTKACSSDADCSTSGSAGKCGGGTKVCTNGTAATNGKPCSSDTTCGGGYCSSPVQSCAGVTYTDPSSKLGYPTQHVRTCVAPSAATAATQCTWPSWSACVPKNSCGDGQLDKGEQCDAGSSNSDTGACTTQCKKNVCGDNNVNVGVEECDNGTDNGKVTCNAAYGSSCLSCSTSCKWQASAGGYCGDGVKNGPEQCDTKDGLGVTCQSLGFDYAESGWTQDCGSSVITVGGVSRSVAALCALGTTYPIVPANGDSTFTSANDQATCSNSCSYNGCERCSDPLNLTADPALAGTIKGTIVDAVYSAPVPNARISLLYNGIKVSETHAKADGTFAFANILNRHPLCTQYKIVVDYYDDNALTPDYNEKLAGGYWPYTSKSFQVGSFNTDGIQNDQGHIFLLPRVQADQTLVAVQWYGSLLKQAGTGISNADIDAHLVLPYAYCAKADGSYTIAPSATDKGSCPSGTTFSRDLDYANRGSIDLTAAPHAKLYCYKFGTVGEVSCAGYDQAPEVMKFTRFYTDFGTYNFYLHDWETKWGTLKQSYSTPLKLSVTVVTPDAEPVTYYPDPPTLANSCSHYKTVWHVFSQDAATGSVTPVNTYLDNATAGTTELVNNLDSAVPIPDSACK